MPLSAVIGFPGPARCRCFLRLPNRAFVPANDDVWTLSVRAGFEKSPAQEINQKVNRLLRFVSYSWSTRQLSRETMIIKNVNRIFARFFSTFGNRIQRHESVKRGWVFQKIDPRCNWKLAFASRGMNFTRSSFSLISAQMQFTQNTAN